MKLEEAKKKIRKKRSEAHSDMDHGSGEEDTKAAGKFEAYTDAINIVEKVDEFVLEINEGRPDSE